MGKYWLSVPMSKKFLALGCAMLGHALLHAQNFDELIKEEKAKRRDSLVYFHQQEKQVYLPLTMITGKEKGPVFSIVAGIHGYEYPPIIAVQELIREINPNLLKGTLIIIPVANTSSFFKRTAFINPIDGKNLNNVFPGSASGTVSEQIAYWITNEVISRSDVFLDIHGGDANEDLLPFICYYNNKQEEKQTDLARKLAEASGIPYVVSYPYTIFKTEPAKYAFKQAVQDGITALSIEAGKLGNVQEENVFLIKNSVYNMLDYMGIYTNERKSESEGETTTFLSNQEYINVPGKGLFYSAFKSGDNVKKDEELGQITDEFGKVLHNIISPTDGVILYKIGTPPVNEGETLFCIGY